MAEPLLAIRGLKTHFKTDDGMVRAVDGVDLTIERGETLGVVGESGCGKTVTAMTVLKLIQMPPGRIVEGSVLWQGRDLVPLSPDEMRRIRSKEIAIVFQEPMTSLNPVYTVGQQIAETIRLHEGMNRRDALDRTIEMLGLVNIPTPERRVHDYPHQFSGGKRQRIGIARALAVSPKLIVCDEPVSALDVSIQAQVINLLEDLQDQFGLTYLFIAHDLSVVEHISTRVAVMYLGRIVEIAAAPALYAAPLHPYTEALLSAVPIPDPTAKRQRIHLAGDVPNPIRPPTGCHFHTRCPIRELPLCSTEKPALRQTRDGHWVACHLRG